MKMYEHVDAPQEVSARYLGETSELFQIHQHVQSVQFLQNFVRLVYFISLSFIEMT